MTTIQLDRPRRLYLTDDSVAKVEEERGDFMKFCRPSGDHEAYVADMLWAFGLADDPELTPLEARTIVRKFIVNAPLFLKARRIKDLRDGCLKAVRVYKKEFLGKLEKVKEK